MFSVNINRPRFNFRSNCCGSKTYKVVIYLEDLDEEEFDRKVQVAKQKLRKSK